MNNSHQPEDDPPGQAPEASRRQFIGYLLGFSVAATLIGVFTPIVSYLWPPSRTSDGGSGRAPIGATTDFPAGQGQVVAVNDKPVMVVNSAQGGLKAYSAICTHLGCITEWDQQRQVILCPCHDGRFNPVNGAVISGPPPAPLPQLQIVVEGDTVYVAEA